MGFFRTDHSDACAGLFVSQNGLRLHQDAIAAGGGAQAQVDIVVIDRELGIESTQIVPRGSSDGQAGSGDRADVAGHAQPGPQSGLFLESADVSGMPAIHHHARVLDGFIGIEEERSDNSYIRTRGLGKHALEPIGRDRKDVVVEEAENVAGGGFDAELVHRAEMERAAVSDDLGGFHRMDVDIVGDHDDFVARVERGAE